MARAELERQAELVVRKQEAFEAGNTEQSEVKAAFWDLWQQVGPRANRLVEQAEQRLSVRTCPRCGDALHQACTGAHKTDAGGRTELWDCANDKASRSASLGTVGCGSHTYEVDADGNDIG